MSWLLTDMLYLGNVFFCIDYVTYEKIMLSISSQT